jgi:exonuclease III
MALSKCGLLNCLGANTKYITLEKIAKKLDLLKLTETWFSVAVSSGFLSQYCPEGYSIIQFPRTTSTTTGRGGGVALVYNNDTVNANLLAIAYKRTTFEMMSCRIKASNRDILLLIVYKPPDSSKPEFVLQFVEMLNSVRLRKNANESLLITGDFNMQQTNVTKPKSHHKRTPFSKNPNKK